MVERELTLGEGLLLQAVRRLALQMGRRTLRPWFERACGCAGPQTHAMLTAFVQQLGTHGLRRIALAAPMAARITPDERLLLDAFGCAQAEDHAGMDRRLQALAATEPPLALGAAACFVAHAFELSGLTLRVSSPPFGAAAPTPLP